MSLTLIIQILFLPFLFVAYSFYKFTHGAGKESGSQNVDFVRFQRSYFAPYFMALFSDWLQGPYVYQLYSHYGFAEGQIAVLFLMGFASSVTFGTATGPLADKFGRKKLILVFCVMYTASCLTKLSPDFTILLIGRLLGGVATSILFSVFESWYLYQHTVVQKFPLEWISNTFSKATFFNGFLAILAGLAGDVVADRLGFGPVSPFMVAIPFLLFAFIIVYRTWDENYGIQQSNWRGSCFEGLQTILRNPLILTLGLLQSIFEANMYIFVFLWTPVLKPGSPPLGLTFACFMIAIMVGSSIYSTLLNRLNYKSEQILTICLGIMSLTMFICSFLTDPEKETTSKGVDTAVPVVDSAETDMTMILTFVSFLVLEIGVGMYFPTVGYLRGEIIPEGLRANIMNWYRVPLNVITCAALMGIRSFHGPRLHQIMFCLCGVGSLAGTILSKRFGKMKESAGNLKPTMELPDSIGTTLESLI